MRFPKYLKTNTRDITYAIQQAMIPMSEWYDPKHDDLPYFKNIVTGSGFGNFHHTSWSGGHCPGRWIETLYNSQLITGIPLNYDIYMKLKKWVYKVYENGLNLPANIDINTFELLEEVDLCNLRESFYGLTTIYLRDREMKALEVAEKVIDTVNKYFNFERNEWDNDLFKRETGATAVGLFTCDIKKSRFCNTFGRFIGGLVQYYQACGSKKALKLAIRFANIALDSVVPEDGSFNPEKTAYHVYSTTSMLSGIAMLADLTGDMLLFSRLKSFMEKGFYQIGIETGWISENLHRSDLVGEINNSCDILEVCLFLGKAGFSKYYERAERMLRGHILPAQVLDTCFISDAEDENDAFDRMASRVKGAFGFPCPFGHEYEPGYEISYNWDIIGGVSGICRAMRHIISYEKGFVSINMLFDFKDSRVELKSPYGNEGTIEVKLRESSTVRIRISTRTDIKKLKSIMSNLDADILGDWLYLYNVPAGEKIIIPIPYNKEKVRYEFNSHEMYFMWYGDEVIAASSEGKRLCFFPEL